MQTLETKLVAAEAALRSSGKIVVDDASTKQIDMAAVRALVEHVSAR